MTFVWTGERDKELRKHFKRGGSAGKLAKKLGVTRNMVCGRKFRLGLCAEGTRYPEYTAQEIAALVVQRSRGVQYKLIAKSLRRPIVMLRRKAVELGITRGARA